MNGIYSSKQFDFNPITKTYVADMSDLGWRAGQRDFKRIYPDACDEGLTLVDHVTGLTCDFVVTEENEEKTTLIPVKGVRGWAMVNTNTKIVLFND